MHGPSARDRWDSGQGAQRVYALSLRQPEPQTKHLNWRRADTWALLGLFAMTVPPSREAAPVSERFDLRQSAIALLSGASSAAACIATQQAQAIDTAATLLEHTVRQERTIWVSGDSADEHQRRLEAAGHRCACMVDPTRLPQSLLAEDLLFVAAVEDVPTQLLTEAQARGVHTVLLKGPIAFSGTADVIIAVDNSDPQVVELTHDFIVTALCAQGVDWDNSESAA